MVLFIYKSKCGCYLGKNIGNIEWGQLTENPNNNNNANTNSNNNRFNRPLTAQQIQAVGAPRGKVSPNNSHGFSKLQNRQLAFLLKIEDSSNSLNQTNSLASQMFIIGMIIKTILTISNIKIAVIIVTIMIWGETSHLGHTETHYMHH